MCVVDRIVNVEQLAKEFGDQYHEPEPEDPYYEQELLDGFEDGKFNLLL